MQLTKRNKEINRNTRCIDSNIMLKLGHRDKGVNIMDKKDLQEIGELLEQKLKAELNEQLQPVKSQLDENTQILKALVHSAEISKAGGKGNLRPT